MRRLRLAFVLATGGVAWTAVLAAVTYLARVYCGHRDMSSCSSRGHCTCQTLRATATLVDTSGGRVLVIVGILIGVAALGWLGLHVYCARGSRVGQIVGCSAAMAIT